MGLDSAEIRARIIPKLNQLGIKNVTAIQAGKQNYVYSGLLHSQTSILKVSDSRHRNVAALRQQIEMLRTLSALTPDACPSIDVVEGLSIIEIDIEKFSFYIVAYQFADGVSGDIQDPDHVQLMGTSLASLHRAMGELPTYAFQNINEPANSPAMAKACLHLNRADAILDSVSSHFESSKKQLLHGDFNAGNLKIDAGRVRIFDFDNCVYGSVSYELANALYMVLFDHATQGTLPVYQTFRARFLAAYEQASEFSVNHQIINDLIAYRVLLLASWLEEPEQAPLFIRHSSPMWLATLESFVTEYFAQNLHALR